MCLVVFVFVIVLLFIVFVVGEWDDDLVLVVFEFVLNCVVGEVLDVDVNICVVLGLLLVNDDEWFIVVYVMVYYGRIDDVLVVLDILFDFNISEVQILFGYIYCCVGQLDQLMVYYDCVFVLDFDNIQVWFYLG